MVKKILFSFIAVLIALQIIKIWQYSIDIPFADEWELFKSGSFLLNPTLKSLYAQHNEHRLILPKLIFNAYLYLFNFNIPIAMILNFLVYASTFLLFLKFSYSSKNLLLTSVLAFMIFSPLNFENHLWVFQIQWHIFLLFLILSCHKIASNDFRKVSPLWFIFLPPCMVFSLGSGLAAALTLIALLITSLSVPKLISKNRLNFLLFVLSSAASLALYFKGYIKPPYHPPYMFPYKTEFWDHYAAIIALGLGNRQHPLDFLSYIVIAFHLFFAYSIFKNWKETDHRSRFLLFLATTMAAVLASISVSRAGLGADQAFSSRYFEFSAFYIASVVSLGFVFLSQRKSATIVLAVLLFLSTNRSYNFDDLYGSMYNHRKAGLNCAIATVKTNAETLCPQIYPLAPVTKIIQDLQKTHPQISFLKHFK